MCIHVYTYDIATETGISKCTVIMGRDHGHPYSTIPYLVIYIM